MKSYLFALLSLAATGMLAAQRSFTIPQVMSEPFASAPRAAPNRATVAWLENDEGKRNIWVAQAPDWTGRQITSFNRDDGQEIDDLAWAPTEVICCSRAAAILKTAAKIRIRTGVPPSRSRRSGPSA